MATFFRSALIYLFLLCACNLPEQGQPTHIASEPPADAATDTPLPELGDTGCGFVWAHEPLPDLSREFDTALKEVLPQASGSADAYGENCLNNQGEVVRFLAMETDYYMTLKVDSLENKQELGLMLEQMLSVLSQFPVGETPGPQPGYVGITFQTTTDELRLWVSRREAEAALGSGLRGEELYLALQEK